MEPVSGQVPFDVSGANGASTAIAATNLGRLATDLGKYAEQVAAEKVSSLRCLDEKSLAKGGAATSKAAIAAVSVLRKLQDQLEAAQLENSQLMVAGLDELRAIAQQPYAHPSKCTHEELD
eukprot:6065154-Prymnesium_polylepis.1